MTAPRILVEKSNLRATRIDNAPNRPLAPGEARLTLDLFSLTANNVTYAAMGDSFRYWNFFPGPEGYGLVPVWGYAVVAESRVDGLLEGERLYGYYPFAQSLVVQPTRMTERGFTDGAAHRAALPPVYNQYERVARDPAWAPADETALALFRPLFITSFVVDDFTAEQGCFNARRIGFAAASSKTALGAAALLKARGGAEIVALTSPANAAFCAATGYYDRVVTYDAIATLPQSEAFALIDMAGDAKVLGALSAHLGAAFVYDMMVGAAHWEAGGPTSGGPKRSLFFAPDRIVQRHRDWGKEGFATRYAAAWAAFKAQLGWLEIEDVKGHDAIVQAWVRLLDGQVRPQTGLICRF
jgi:NADPH:quinone reductase-like Zn-dependent oxidoreductase